LTAGDEVLEHLPTIAKKRRLDLGVLPPVVETEAMLRW
jgi:hypothetical protein